MTIIPKVTCAVSLLILALALQNKHFFHHRSVQPILHHSHTHTWSAAEKSEARKVIAYL